MSNCANDCEYPEQLDRRYRRSLGSYFRKRGCIPSSADDLTQDVLLRVLVYQRTNSIRNLDAFLFQTAANLFRDRARAARRWPTTSLDVAGNAHASDSLLIEPITPERMLEASQEMKALSAAILELDSRSRLIFLMNRVDRMKLREIADHLGLSLSLVEKSLRRAQAFLETRVRRDHHPTAAARSAPSTRVPDSYHTIQP